MEQLIEDYQKKIEEIKCMQQVLSENTDPEVYTRLNIKMNCYKTFISELNRIISENSINL